MVFMKGTPQKPSCGFSEHTCDILKEIRYVTFVEYTRVKTLTVGYGPGHAG